MEYELAKKLKDKGFPFKSLPNESRWFPDQVYWIPTLSELIHACENEFEQLSKGINGGWYASPVRGTAQGLVGIGGKTPEEAVAKLWLKLNN